MVRKVTSKKSKSAPKAKNKTVRRAVKTKPQPKKASASKKKRLSPKITLKKIISKIRKTKKKTISSRAKPISSSAQYAPKKTSSFSEGGYSPIKEESIFQEIQEAKFDRLESAATEEAVLNYNLPSEYNDDRITLPARDPWWLHTYWDISAGRVSEVMAKIPVHERESIRWVIRVYDVTGISDFKGANANYYYDIEINFAAKNWYINTNKPERTWCVEIGLMTLSGRFYAVARSNYITSPYFGISESVDEEWSLADEDYYKVLGVYELGKSSFELKERAQEIFNKQLSSLGRSVTSSEAFGPSIKPRKFFLEVATELILYGRTEPNAALKVEGKKVKLNKDGTFSLRYFLPPGDFKFHIEAESEDKVDKIKVIPAVTRYEKK